MNIDDEFFHFMVGNIIGEGSFRIVYELNFHDDLVLKYEKREYSFSNIHEWDLWNTGYQYPDLQKWLAPCKSISACGRYLLQYKTEPVRECDLPKFIPEWLCDIKQDNFGWYNDRVVSHDYAINLASVMTKKVKKAKWSIYT